MRDKLSTPVRQAEDIIPDDATEFPATRAVFIGGEGSLHCMMCEPSDVSGSMEVTYENMLRGWQPIQIWKVFADSTATGIVGAR